MAVILPVVDRFQVNAKDERRLWLREAQPFALVPEQFGKGRQLPFWADGRQNKGLLGHLWPFPCPPAAPLGPFPWLLRGFEGKLG